MVKKVLKFGGTSVGSIDRIQHVAKIIKKESDIGNEIIVVVSAMSGKTNELMKLSREISEKFNKRELDVLLSSGEQVSCSLLAGALINLDIEDYYDEFHTKPSGSKKIANILYPFLKSKLSKIILD